MKIFNSHFFFVTFASAIWLSASAQTTAKGATNGQNEISSGLSSSKGSIGSAEVFGAALSTPDHADARIKNNSEQDEGSQHDNDAVTEGNFFNSISVDTRATVNEIRATTFETRNEIADSVDGRLNAADQSLSYLRGRSAAIGSPSRYHFERAVNSVRRQEIQVRSSLRAVRLSSRDKFQDARDQLASDFASYVGAAAQAEAAGQASVSSLK